MHCLFLPLLPWLNSQLKTFDTRYLFSWGMSRVKTELAWGIFLACSSHSVIATNPPRVCLGCVWVLLLLLALADCLMLSNVVLGYVRLLSNVVVGYVRLLSNVVVGCARLPSNVVLGCVRLLSNGVQGCVKICQFIKDLSGVFKNP